MKPKMIIIKEKDDESAINICMVNESAQINSDNFKPVYYALNGKPGI